ncbi:hypothetical protein J4731_01985 [Providencia rettgeri]|nr:hypothetical protein [Providencia rettgeri]
MKAYQLHPLRKQNDIQTLIALVAAEVGISLLPYSARNISSKDIRFIPIQHSEQAQWGLMWYGRLHCLNYGKTPSMN